VYQHPLTTGDPVFLKLIDRLNVGFRYDFEAEGDHDLAGRASLVAVVSQENGWKREIPLVAAESFSGDSLDFSGTLDLAHLTQQLQQMQRLTGQESDIYSVDLEATVDVEGVVQGTKFSDTFEPTLPMQLDGTSLDVAPSETSEGFSEQAATSRSRSVPVPATKEAAIDLGPLHLSLANARTVGVAGGILCLILLIAFGIPLLVAYRRDEATKISARYGPLLVPMRSVSGIEGSLAEVDDIEALVRLADRYDRLVLHEQNNGVHRYFVEGDGVVYFYQAKEEASA
jgi:hypothetical protein